jgi:hypothetical protein
VPHGPSLHVPKVYSPRLRAFPAVRQRVRRHPTLFAA